MYIIYVVYLIKLLNTKSFHIINYKVLQIKSNYKITFGDNDKQIQVLRSKNI